MTMFTVTPVHKWAVGPPRKRGSVLLALPPEDARAAHGRPGKLLLLLTELWVPPAGRGQGYAKALMGAATEWADASGTDLWLYVAPHGPAPRLDKRGLRALYTAHKFKRCAPDSPDLEMLRYARVTD